MHISGSGRRHLQVPAAASLSVAATMAVAALTAAVSSDESSPPLFARTAPVTARAATTTPDLPPRTRPSPTPATTLPGAGAPHRVIIESLGVDVLVIAVASEGRSLEPPPDPQVLGWWSEGSRPGDAQGSALVTGHTVHDGGGALDELEEMRAGASIAVHTASGVVRYVVESVDVLDKDTIAWQAPQLFSQDVPGRLVLVTCEDWDGTGYRSNVVVTATPRT